MLILADEPTGNLDPDLSLDIMNLLREVNARGTTVLIATHDRELIRRVGRRAIALDHGRLDRRPTSARPRPRGEPMRALSYFFDEASPVCGAAKDGLDRDRTIAVAFVVLGGFLFSRPTWSACSPDGRRRRSSPCISRHGDRRAAGGDRENRSRQRARRRRRAVSKERRCAVQTEFRRAR